MQGIKRKFPQSFMSRLNLKHTKNLDLIDSNVAEVKCNKHIITTKRSAIKALNSLFKSA